MSGPRVVAVAGHLCVDVTPELGEAPGLEPGRLYEVGAARLTLGGCVANTALALHATGVPTRVSATVGDDPLGEIARRLLDEQGIGTEGVATAQGRRRRTAWSSNPGGRTGRSGTTPGPTPPSRDARWTWTVSTCCTWAIRHCCRRC